VDSRKSITFAVGMTETPEDMLLRRMAKGMDKKKRRSQQATPSLSTN